MSADADDILDDIWLEESGFTRSPGGAPRWDLAAPAGSHASMLLITGGPGAPGWHFSGSGPLRSIDAAAPRTPGEVRGLILALGLTPVGAAEADDGKDYFDDGTPHPETGREWAALLAKAAVGLAVQFGVLVAVVRVIYWANDWPWGPQ